MIRGGTFEKGKERNLKRKFEEDLWWQKKYLLESEIFLYFF